MTAVDPDYRTAVLVAETDTSATEAQTRIRERVEAEDAAIRGRLDDLAEQVEGVTAHDFDSLDDAHEAVKGLGGVVTDLLRLMRDLATDTDTTENGVQ